MTYPKNRVAPLHELDEFQVAEGDPDPRGWDVIASDGRRIGTVHDLLVDTGHMRVRYLDVNVDDDRAAGTHRDLHILVPIGYARLENDRQVVVDELASSEVASLPPYTRKPLTRDYEESLQRSYDPAYRAHAEEFYEHHSYDEERFYGSRES
jgi:photosynthetic reaction center H subunit